MQPKRRAIVPLGCSWLVGRLPQRARSQARVQSLERLSTAPQNPLSPCAQDIDNMRQAVIGFAMLLLFAGDADER
jgi:hypothetical protein